MGKVLAVSLVNNHLGFGVIPTGWVYAHKLAVFPLDDRGHFAVLQSNMHYHWAWHQCSTMRRDINYSPSDCFETFPFPTAINNLNRIGMRYYLQRQSIMETRKDGLTRTYNRLHNSADRAGDIEQLRTLRAEMDCLVADAYGWTDLDLGHDFHETKQGIRFTVSESARREILDRLLALNHQRYAEEVAQGLHDKGSKPKATRKKAKADQEELF
jgi:hypothetical protein